MARLRDAVSASVEDARAHEQFTVEIPTAEGLRPIARVRLSHLYYVSLHRAAARHRRRRLFGWPQARAPTPVEIELTPRQTSEKAEDVDGLGL